MKKSSSIPVIYEDDYVFAVNKPPKVASVPSPGLDIQQTVLGMVQEQFQDRDFKPYILHRLDSDTSGVLLFGKHQKDREALENIFREKTTRKIYVTLVKGIPRGGVLRMKLKARHTDVAVDAETKFKVLQVFKTDIVTTPCAFVEAEIITGRKHQIRQHFSTIGCPVVMDHLYGDEKFNSKFYKRYKLGRQFLHAASVSFINPITGKTVMIETKLPPDLMSTIKKMA